jgi:hypothetical protein
MTEQRPAAHFLETAIARAMSFVLGGLSESAHTDTAKPFEKRIGFLYKPKLYKNYFNRRCRDRQPFPRQDKMCSCVSRSVQKQLSVLSIRCHRRVIRFDTNLKLGRKLHESRARLPRATSSLTCYLPYWDVSKIVRVHLRAHNKTARSRLVCAQYAAS